MSVEIKVPPLSESLVDAVVGQWLKHEGDEVSRGEAVVALETDKVNLDVTAEEDGVLARIDKHEGDVVTVGEVLGEVATGAAAAKAAPAKAEAAAAPAAPPIPQPAAPTAPPAAAPVPTEAAEAAAAGRAAPAVRRLAEEHNIDLAALAGSGPGGRVTREDVLLAARAQTTNGAAQAAPPAAAEPVPAAPAPVPVQSAPLPTVVAPVVGVNGREERVRLSRRRQTIAQRLVEAQRTAAMLTTFNEVDMSAVMELRARRKEAFKERFGVNLGYMSFFTKAAVGALKAYPQVNAELDGDELILKKHYDIGIAVGLEEGLVVPVVRDADRKSFAEIEREIVELATKARENRLALSDLMGGTFTITNGGVYGSLMSTPILNAPQVGILGMHAIQQRPVVRNNEIVIRPMMYIALSYDHRVVDGREAVQFLVKVKELVEDPETLLLEG
ncbi:MAG TPA: 2-oxoglutarate dehydrogenase complex dihydrolipoyllysine-residue succinyltransferase [Thermomicrobiales bacterium]|nr:2-oxoglutarate dehydrogenase complex dihydrolipoyllysine-residue succinyltransferase [Thermomicrobiales bacterium]